MTLYEMLDKTKYYQEVWIFENNIFDQNMPIFKGTVQEARSDADMTWDYLMCEVEMYDCTTGILDIRVRNEYYNERLEGHYITSGKWDDERGKRRWLWSAEIDADLRGRKESCTQEQ